ncbi:MAG TPA: hypothetical protein VG929_08895 [Actinomycetota bacterium]|nr:hypothetical protein [Actinomycetota bacterium]
MKKKLFALLAACLVAIAVPSAGAGPSAGGYSSDNVEWVKYVPFDVGTASGAQIIGKHLYVTSWRNFTIYDISDPLNPELLSDTPFGFKFENEDVDSNGEILIFSETAPRSALHIWDVEDKTNPVQIAELAGAGQHTMSCLYDCKWLYGSDGYIIDLRNPTKPKKLGNMWTDGLTISSPHDVNEVAPGRVLTASDPLVLLDTTNPAKPKAIGTSEPNGEFIHTSKWPRGAKDRWALSTGETWIAGLDSRCDQTSGGFSTWDTAGWQKKKAFKKVDTFRPPSGTATNGYLPAGTTFGCSTHWFEHHPTFNNGGIVAVTFFNSGTHFMRVDKKGKISDEGWFIPHAGSSAAVEWVTDRIVYAIDLQKGFDVLRYTGKL